MKHIAIFCDGTWNKPDNKHQTNVWHVSQMIPSEHPDGTHQVAKYFKGVGTGEGGNRLGRAIDQYGGGAFGWGLQRKIEKAYIWLAEVFQPGDQIYIFGFSRGAYTARSLSGLIRASGIPPKRNFARIPEAFARYRSRAEETHPRSDASAAFRAEFSPDVVTGEGENAWRAENGKAAGHELKIAYLGIWDTVGALGVPGFLGAIAKPFNAKYLFHDAQLSSWVQAGRHALATDEARLFYPPTLWENLDTLNAKASGRPYRQEWFAGDHGMVGGSGRERGLSNCALAWVAEGAVDAGLAFHPEKLAAFQRAQKYYGPLSNRSGTSILRKPRKVNAHCQVVSDATMHRLAFGGDDGKVYDPKTLRPLQRRLAALLPTEQSTQFA
ncbi:DUF2235 domain-containing protein [Actibacterium lipolyticum]|uniref:T6SS Phospholipase effector Tle1-like catalytic domain-containing protein n=1 Tax=Actibacterium lipolyticum TaxID=1524263 RepID=A0A238KI54_9RHOB|nr:DUF2235 domain-containing protein [Actibacterium lipolyticum]SMX42284.1 hypothetical protein COL8621_01931 [Actibacterium lipolyticum]